MASGVVKWFSSSRGYGFISREDGPDVFVHSSALEATGPDQPTLLEGQRVEFDVVQAEKGLQATNVRLVE